MSVPSMWKSKIFKCEEMGVARSPRPSGCYCCRTQCEGMGVARSPKVREALRRAAKCRKRPSPSLQYEELDVCQTAKYDEMGVIKSQVRGNECCEAAKWEGMGVAEAVKYEEMSGAGRSSARK